VLHCAFELFRVHLFAALLLFMILLLSCAISFFILKN